jgi:TATA-box binding protein (TBP) (component of TFIID and TFIIIB)
MASKTELKVTNLSISTCTVITNLNSKINLGLLSRFVDIYDQNAQQLDEKAGGVFNLEFYGNCARGETLIDKIKDEFNNQATIKFKYWGFRNLNIKVFANGKLQLTGPKYEEEAIVVANLLINILKNIKIKIVNDIKKLADVPDKFDYQLFYDIKTKKVYYYRKYYNRFLNVYNFNLKDVLKKVTDTETNTVVESATNVVEPVIAPEPVNVVESVVVDTKKSRGGRKIKLKEEKQTNQEKQAVQITLPIVKLSETVISPVVTTNIPLIISPDEFTVDFARKGYNKDVHDFYNDPMKTDDIAKDWSGDNYVKSTIEIIERIKEYFGKEIEKILTTSTNLEQLKTKMNDIMTKYNDLAGVSIDKQTLDKLITDINKNYYNDDEHTLIDIKSRIYQYAKQYKNLCEKKINRLVTIRTIDINICHWVKQYLDTLDKIVFDTEGKISIPIEDIELKAKIIDEPHNYFVSDTETVMINSDLSINHNINLKKMSKVLKKLGMFNTYYPDEYPGVLTKYYYNPTNKIQGICSCTPHCSTKEKHSVCTKITISIFRPGSIIITGPRNTTQLMLAHDLIIKILKEHIDSVKGGLDNEDDEDSKQIGLMNNEIRKISRKPRLFYFKRNSIVDYDKVVE